jgi:hypothetical protein
LWWLFLLSALLLQWPLVAVVVVMMMQLRRSGNVAPNCRASASSQFLADDE